MVRRGTLLPQLLQFWTKLVFSKMIFRRLLVEKGSVKFIIFGTFSKIFSAVCSKLHSASPEELLRFFWKHISLYFPRILSLKFLTGSSKLHSTCPEEHFGGKIPKLFFHTVSAKFSKFERKNWTSLTLLYCTCPEEHVKEEIFRNIFTKIRTKVFFSSAQIYR